MAGNPLSRRILVDNRLIGRFAHQPIGSEMKGNPMKPRWQIAQTRSRINAFSTIVIHIAIMLGAASEITAPGLSINSLDQKVVVGLADVVRDIQQARDTKHLRASCVLMSRE